MTTPLKPASLIGESAATVRIRKRIEQVANYRYSVLIAGPSGTGKELVAQSIHAQSSRADKPFVPVNCAALPGGLFASQLFGHLKGAFTGAQFNSLGCFRAADQGTIFLDEIGELDLELQSKLLRVLQERTVVPVGGHEAIPVDVRVIAATNRDLEEEVRAGRFRLDLYYRLNVISVDTIALKDRPEDIEVLARHFLAKAAVENGSDIKKLSPAAVALLQSYAFPGNVRELQNLIERAIVFCEGDIIGCECFPTVVDTCDQPIAVRQMASQVAPTLPASRLPAAARMSAALAPVQPAETSESEWPTLDEIEAEHIRRTLQQTFYNQSAASRLLNIDRKLLARKIRKYKLRLPASPAAREKTVLGNQ